MTLPSKMEETVRRSQATALAAVLAVAACGAVSNASATERVVIPSASAIGATSADGTTSAQLVSDSGKPLTPSKLLSGLSTLHAEYLDYWGSTTAALRPAEAFQSQKTVSHVTADGRVAIDAVAADDPEQLRADLESLGAQVTAVAGRILSARLPIEQIPSLEGITSLAFARPVVALTNSGLAMTQGDAAMFGEDARFNGSVSGAGVTVGIISDSFDCLGGTATDITNSELPPMMSGGFLILTDDAATGCTSTDEGRAMAQVVHDVAPGAAIVFRTGVGGQAAIADSIAAMRVPAVDADLIVDDMIYPEEPMFQDGVVAQAIDESHVPYFSAAGNAGRQGYDAAFLPCDTCGAVGGLSHDFDPGEAVDPRLNVRQTSDNTFVLQWSDSYFSLNGAPGAVTDLDLCFYSPPNANKPFACAEGDNIGGDPIESLTVALPTGVDARVIGVGIKRYDGPVPTRMKLVMFGDATFKDEYAGTGAGTIYGHAAAAGATAVGAIDYHQTPYSLADPATLNYSSSAGDVEILFDSAGAPTSEIRPKPELTAPDGGDNSFFGINTDETLEFPNFSGTSAAAAHAAGAAALLVQKSGVPSTLPVQTIPRLLQETAVDLQARAPRLDIDLPSETGAACDPDSGAGLIDVDAALAALPLANADQFGVWHPGDGTFDLDEMGREVIDSCTLNASGFGLPTDIPLSGDWDGDGNDEIGVWRPSNHTFFLDGNGNRRWEKPVPTVLGLGTNNGASIVDVDRSGTFGMANDIPIVGDWNGDGRDEIGVWRPSTATFFLDMNGDIAWQNPASIPGAQTSVMDQDRSVTGFGIPGDIPVIGNWNGTTGDEIGVWRPSKRIFYLDDGDAVWSSEDDTTSGAFGISTDVPVSGDWNADGTDDIGVWRSSTGTFHIDADGDHTWNGENDSSVPFGEAGDKPMIGLWARYRFELPPI